jgi:hypothetical protein
VGAAWLGSSYEVGGCGRCSRLTTSTRSPVGSSASSAMPEQPRTPANPLPGPMHPSSGPFAHIRGCSPVFALIGETGFEPATARPPAARRGTQRRGATRGRRFLPSADRVTQKGGSVRWPVGGAPSTTSRPATPEGPRRGRQSRPGLPCRCRAPSEARSPCRSTPPLQPGSSRASAQPRLGRVARGVAATEVAALQTDRTSARGEA